MKNREILKGNHEQGKSESRIQSEIVRWYRNTYCLVHYNPRCMIFSIPNEGRAQASAGLIATGLYPGCADLFIMHTSIPLFYLNNKPLYHQVFIEVKTPTGIQSPKQKQFQKHCNQMGIPYHVVRSLEDFKCIVEKL